MVSGLGRRAAGWPCRLGWLALGCLSVSTALTAATEPATPTAARVHSTFFADSTFLSDVTVSAPSGEGSLLSLLPIDHSFAWVREGEGLVAWGVAAEVSVSGDERFSRAQRWWNDWLRSADIHDDVGLPGSGPVAFASFTFDPASEGSRVVIPRVIIGRRDGRSWLTIINPIDVDPATEAIAPVPLPREPGETVWHEGTRTADEWMSTVSEAISRIQAGELDKVVLARDVIAQVQGGVDSRALLHRLAASYPECWTFSVSGLVGATPELLVRRTGDVVTSRVLAGTVKRRGEATADASLAAALLGSGKDLEEHEYAVRSVARALSTHCTDLDVPVRPRVLSLPNVQHLVTDVTGQLVDDAPVLALAASLHPTAAVCGTPTERALSLIREVEGMDRGRYSGPVGWFDAQGDGEFGIALRCAEISADSNTLRLFAGCGIVAGSDPESELAESRAKFVPVRDALQPEPPRA
jgi:menaquinone-specific isochorismate synthase